MLRSFNIEGNFWEQNLEVKYISPFSELYKEDKSKNKSDSSSLMWGLFLFEWPTDENKFFRMDADLRKENVEQNYWGGKRKLEDYEDLLIALKDNVMTKEEAEYADVWAKWHERKKFIRQTPYTIETADFLDKAFANTERLFTIITRTYEEMIKRKQDDNLRGKQKKSLTEQL